jgi:putative PIN family toxin of toxin-antitoxin system
MLVKHSVPARLVDLILREGRLVFAEETFSELESRIWKPKFDRYISIERRKRILHDFDAAGHWVTIPKGLRAQRYSRDADDDWFVRSALAARVARLVSGDKDLLDLDTIGSLRIVTPRTALSEIPCERRTDAQ